MFPICVDPNYYDKLAAFEQAKDYVLGFLDANGIAHPYEIITEAKNPSGLHGWYNPRFQQVFVDVKRSRPPVKTPGFAWSFTGSKADLTVTGVLAHEVGHHVHHMFMYRGQVNSIMQELKRIRRLEARLSGYEPNVHETFAECFRLFALNPELLRVGRPMRWKLMLDLELKPAHSVPWREVLVHAHPKLITSLERWIEKGA